MGGNRFERYPSFNQSIKQFATYLKFCSVKLLFVLAHQSTHRTASEVHQHFKTTRLINAESKSADLSLRYTAYPV